MVKIKQWIFRLLIFQFSIFNFQSAFATHNRAGEITYKHLTDNCLTYEITITTYTKTSSCPPACRPSLDSVHMGDGTIEQFLRTSSVDLPGRNITVNKYVNTHTYPGSGTDTIYFVDPNRNADVINVPSSVGVPFCIYSVLVISPGTIYPCNDSPVLLNPPIDSGCVGVPFIHNPVAIDADTSSSGIFHDSLSYEFTICRGNGDLPIPGYTFPKASTSLKLDSITGDLVWDSPMVPNPIQAHPWEYNIAFLIKEWRGGVFVGAIERDMQITIIDNCANHPPDIHTVADTCVLAGDTLALKVRASDPDHNKVVLTAIGDALYPVMTFNPATFTTDSRGTQDTVNGFFSWSPNCKQIRRQPYHVEFKAQDTLVADTSASLVDYKGLNITVVGPAPSAPTATPNNANMDLHWSPYSCPNIYGYRIYRHQGFFNDTILCPCQTGVPSATGFTLIGTTKGLNDTNFTDTNNGHGLNVGILYCYMITVLFPDGSESCASPQGCARLKKDLPVITNVTVDSTSIPSGIDTILWSMPTQIDSVRYPPPYQYKIYRLKGFSGSNFTFIDTLPHGLADTIYQDSGFDTDTSPWAYRIALYYDSSGTATLKGYSQTASSIFLTLTPTDKKMILSWHEEVPWSNYRYDIFRLRKGGGWNWDSVGTSVTQTFTDTGLVNGDTNCYYVRSVGTYSTPGIVDPIINLSERECGIPVDNVPPCPPQLAVTADCIENANFLQWNNPNHSCATDVAKYKIYYAPDSVLDFVVLDSIIGANDTTFTHQKIQSLAACYKVTAIDSMGNESAANVVCVDTCRQYVLPSVFTPNGDGDNDVFHPCDSTTAAALQKKNCPPYKNVKDVEMKIYNRWGNLVFETTDKDINWDGKNKDSKGDCPDGVYYYTCKVNFFRLKGFETRELHGYIHLIREKP